MYIIAKGDGNDTDTNCIAAAKVGGNRNRSAVHSRGPQKAAPHRNARDTRNEQWEDWGTVCLSEQQDFNHSMSSETSDTFDSTILTLNYHNPQVKPEHVPQSEGDLTDFEGGNQSAHNLMMDAPVITANADEPTTDYRHIGCPYPTLLFQHKS